MKDIRDEWLSWVLEVEPAVCEAEEGGLSGRGRAFLHENKGGPSWWIRTELPGHSVSCRTGHGFAALLTLGSFIPVPSKDYYLLRCLDLKKSGRHWISFR